MRNVCIEDQFDYMIPCCTDNAVNQENLPKSPPMATRPERSPPLRRRSSGIMNWLWEYLYRLEDGIYQYEPKDLTDPSVRPSPSAERFISIYPTATYRQKPLEERLSHREAASASVAVTRGIEVTAAPIFVPEKSSTE
jgi:hypothetical protein